MRRLLLPFLLLPLLPATGCASASPGGALAFPRVAAPRGSHVVVIVMENHELSQVVGRPDAPFITSMARHGALATAYTAVAHPSLPNYLALVGGSTFHITSDCTDCSVSAPSLPERLEGAGVSWRAYMEDLPAPCFTGAFYRGYARKHDPFLYFSAVRSTPARCRRVVGLAQLPGDLAAGTLPSFAWITPNLCDDMHDCSVAQGDGFLSRLVPPLLRALGPSGFLALTFDEGTSDAGGGGRVATIVMGPHARAGARVGTAYTHYSLLRTVERALGVGPLQAARNAPALDAMFTRPPVRVAAR